MATRIVFLDCDGTLTTVKSSWEYLHRRLNLWNGNADEYQTLFRQGVIDYREFCRRDALLWKGLSVGDLKSMISEIPYQPGAKDLVASLKGAGIITVIVSTGLSFLVEKVRGELSIDLSFSNDLLYRDGRLSGEISINVDHDLKGPVVRRTLERLRLSPAEASAIGDGEGDRGMFEEVGLPIGFNTNGSPRRFPPRTVYIDELREAKPLLGVV